jgi:hypothetical protein
MPYPERRAAAHFVNSLAVSFLALATLSGCGDGGKTEKQAREEYYKNNPKAAGAMKPVGQFAGKVTIDGQPPEEGIALFVVLNDFDHPTAGAPKFTRCNPDGSFEFKTYDKADGVPAGTYVVEFVGLHAHKLHPRSMTTPFVGPDALKNLYNDPEKNKNNKDFVINITPPGRTDYAFDLKVEGKEPATPGKLALTQLNGI